MTKTVKKSAKTTKVLNEKVAVKTAAKAVQSTKEAVKKTELKKETVKKPVVEKTTTPPVVPVSNDSNTIEKEKEEEEAEEEESAAGENDADVSGNDIRRETGDKQGKEQ